MKEQHDPQYVAAYMVREAGEIVKGGIVEIEPRPGRNGWAEQISPIPSGRIREFVETFTPEMKEEATILTSPKYPGVELIFAQNTLLTGQQIAEAIRDVYERIAKPRTFAVQPNPVKS